MVATRSTRKRVRLHPPQEEVPVPMKVDCDPSAGPPIVSAALCGKKEQKLEAETATMPPIEEVQRENKSMSSTEPLLPSSNPRTPSLDMLPVELLPEIFLYFDSPRDVMNLALCSKTIYATVTPTMVTRAIVFEGDKHIMRAVSQIIWAVENQLIHPPPPMRMLRLALAQRCERMDECFAWNTDLKVPAALPVHNERPYGLAICNTCRGGLSTMHGNRGSWHSVFHAFRFGEMLLEPQFELATNTPVGPTVCFKHIRRVEGTETQKEECEDRLWMMVLEDEERRQSQENNRLELLESFCKAKSEYAGFIEGQKKMAAEKKRQVSVARATNRRERVSTVLEAMEKILDKYELKSTVLAHTWNNKGDCELKYAISKALLGRILAAPSSVTKKKMNQALSEAREAFDVLFSQGFIPGKALKLNQVFQLPRTSKAPRSIRLLFEYFTSNYDVDSLLEKEGTETVEFIELVRQGKPWLACSTLLVPEEYHRVFEEFATSNTPVQYENKAPRLIDWVWRHHPATGMLRDKIYVPNYKSFNQIFLERWKGYQMLVRRFQQYVQNPDTAAFLSQTFGGFSAFSRLSGQHVVSILWIGDSAPMLWNRDFESLLDRHRSILNQPFRQDLLSEFDRRYLREQVP